MRIWVLGRGSRASGLKTAHILHGAHEHPVKLKKEQIQSFCDDSW